MLKKTMAMLTSSACALMSFSAFPVVETVRAEEETTGCWKLRDVSTYYGETLVEEHHTYTWEMQEGWDSDHWKYHCQNLTTSGNSGEHPDPEIGVVHDHTGETMDHYFYVTPLKETYLPGETAVVQGAYRFETTVPAKCQAILWTGLPSVGEVVDEAWEDCGFKICQDNREGVEYVRTRYAGNPGELGIGSGLDSVTRRNLDTPTTDVTFEMPDQDNGEYWGVCYVGYTLHAGHSMGFTTVFTYDWTAEESTEKIDLGAHEIIATNFNIYTVSNKPTKESKFEVERPCKVYSLLDYHWNNAKGQTPGKIELLKDGESIGIWRTVGMDGQGGVKNANWIALPEDLILEPVHVYQVIDSDPDTWAKNSSSNGEGFYEVRGEYLDEPATEPTTEPTTEPATHPTTEPATDPTEPFKLDAHDIIVTNFNIYTVSNKPTKDSKFEVERPCKVYTLLNYHWNNAKGQTPGTIELLKDGESIGVWHTFGMDGQGGVKNANWIAQPENLILEPGHVYQVIDSDPDTWAKNNSSNGEGFYEVRGEYLDEPATEPTTQPTSETLEVLVSNYNISGVRNKPTKDSVFTVEKDCYVKLLNTYHWNNAQGQTPGTITLLEDGRELGTWQTTGSDGQGGVKNAIWIVRIDPVRLSPGHSYQIVDSDPDTWAQNSGSGGAGFFELQGTYLATTGDATGDGVINAKDANAVLLAAAKIGTGQPSGLTAEQEAAADVNGDSAINSVDANIILRYAAALGAGSTKPITDFINL